MKLTLITVGKLKVPYWIAAQSEYLERIRHYEPISVVEVRDRTPDMEERDILAAAEGHALIALTPVGKVLESKFWAQTFQKLRETYSNLAFVIGGPEGLPDEVLKKSRLQLSLSPMTFPHDLARIIFLEQLYRAFTILNNEKYHK